MHSIPQTVSNTFLHFCIVCFIHCETLRSSLVWGVRGHHTGDQRNRQMSAPHHIVGASLYDVSLTLFGTVLTLELPSISCLRCLGKAIRNEVKCDLFTESFPHFRNLLRYKSSAVRTKTLVVKVDVEAEGDWEQEEEEGKETHPGHGKQVTTVTAVLSLVRWTVPC